MPGHYKVTDAVLLRSLTDLRSMTIFILFQKHIFFISFRTTLMLTQNTVNFNGLNTFKPMQICSRQG